MSYDGLRDWLVQVNAMGELRTLEGIDWNLEMGAVVDVLYREHPPIRPPLFSTRSRTIQPDFVRCLVTSPRPNVSH